jgi:transposase
VKRNILVDEKGAPLAIVICGANKHDVTQLKSLLEAKIVHAPKKQVENLCLDAGYVGVQKLLGKNTYVLHIRPRGEEKKEIRKDPDFKPKRWIVEVAHSWFNRFRKILVRFEKKAANYLALLQFAAALICFRKADIIYG